MDPVLFGAKRAYYATVAYGRKVLAEFGLTPARFEVMRLLLKFMESETDLRKQLGLARSTLSRMLSVLEGLGWVARETSRSDHRTRICRLTPEGELKVREVVHSAIRSNVVRDDVNRTLRTLPKGAVSQRRSTMMMFHAVCKGLKQDLPISFYWKYDIWGPPRRHRPVILSFGLASCLAKMRFVFVTSERVRVFGGAEN